MTAVAGLMSLDDLRRAYRVTQTAPENHRPLSARPAVARWSPATDERVVLACGCGGASGVTTVALALATVAGRARVVETCGGTASGLGYAATAELGVADRGWLRGTRDTVVVERRSDSSGSPDGLPAPTASDLPLTIVDSSWDVVALLKSSGWLGELARTTPSVVLVTRATIPGLRRLTNAVELVGDARAIAVTVGARRWPRPVEQSAGVPVRRLRDAGRVVPVPELPALAMTGLTPDPLPPALLRPARTLLTLLEGPLP
jgi:hypothetical protein